MGEWGSGLIGAIIGTVISGVLSFLVLRFNYRQLYAEIVSKSRDEWLGQMRDHLSKLLAEIRKPTIKNADEEKANGGISLSNDYYNAKFQLFLRLNEKEPLHIALKKEIEELEGIVSSKCVDKINDVENRILEIARTVLKIEWDRVRQEAKGEK